MVAGDGHQKDDEDEPWEIDDDRCPERSVPQVIQAFLGGDIGMPQRYHTHTDMTNSYWLFLASFPPTGDDDGSSSSEAGDIPAKLVEARLPSLCNVQQGLEEHLVEALEISEVAPTRGMQEMF